MTPERSINRPHTFLTLVDLYFRSFDLHLLYISPYAKKKKSSTAII